MKLLGNNTKLGTVERNNFDVGVRNCIILLLANMNNYLLMRNTTKKLGALEDIILPPVRSTMYDIVRLI